MYCAASFQLDAAKSTVEASAAFRAGRAQCAAPVAPYGPAMGPNRHVRQPHQSMGSTLTMAPPSLLPTHRTRPRTIPDHEDARVSVTRCDRSLLRSGRSGREPNRRHVKQPGCGVFQVEWPGEPGAGPLCGLLPSGPGARIATATKAGNHNGRPAAWPHNRQCQRMPALEDAGVRDTDQR